MKRTTKQLVKLFAAVLFFMLAAKVRVTLYRNDAVELQRHGLF